MTQNNTTGRVIQIKNALLATVLDCSTVMPRDNTIPQNTEGDQILTLSITPKLSTSILRIFCCGFGSNNASSASMCMALFQDSTANALSAKSIRSDASNGTEFDLQYNMTSGTTSSTTFTIRVGHTGGAGAGHFYVNGNSAGTQLMGGVASTTMTIVEYLP